MVNSLEVNKIFATCESALQKIRCENLDKTSDYDAAIPSLDVKSARINSQYLDVRL